MSDTMRAAVIASFLLAGSCAAPTNDTVSTIDPDVVHAITVEPTTKSVRLSYSAADAGLMPEDEARFDEFAASYESTGNGAISVTVPSGPGA
ncbi:MAG TPA: CpaD family pilus assembly lipoprotein, partial [Rhizomicrobium sp.]